MTTAGRAAGRLLLALAACFLGAIFSVTVSDGSVYGYDGQRIARADVRGIEEVKASPAQLSIAREESASPVGASPDTSTTPAPFFVAPRALPPGSPGRVVGNALEPHELAQAQRIVDFRGGTFVGNAQRGAPGIDGTLNGVNASLKTYSGSSPAGVLRHASRAEASAANAGYSGVDVFIDAGNVSRSSILGNRGLAAIPSQGTVSSIYVRTADGWVVFPG